MKSDIISVLDLLNTDFNELLVIKNFGRGTLEKVKNVIIEFLQARATNVTSEFVHLDYCKTSTSTNHLIKNNYRIKVLYPLYNQTSLQSEYPKSFLALPITFFNFPIRFINYLKRIETIKCLADILNINASEMMAKRNIGKSTIKRVMCEIETKYQKYLASDEPDYQNNIIKAVDDIFLELGKRDLEIAYKRWNQNGVEALEIIASDYNLTRERVRQIIERIINKFKTRYDYCFDRWKIYFRDKLLEKPEPISKEIIVNTPASHPPNIYLGILSEVFEEVPFRDFIPKSIGQLINRKIMVDKLWCKIVDTLNYIHCAHGEITPRKLESILFSKGFTISEELLCFKIILGQKKYFFFNENGNYFLLRKGGIREMTYKILNNSEGPLSIYEIMVLVHKYYGEGSKYDSPNSVIGNIKQDERITQFDKYVFGVDTHFAYPKNEWKDICEISKEFLKKEKRQCYITEILEKVRGKYPRIKSKYELVFILRTDLNIKDLGFFNFTLTSFGQQERIKVSDLIRNLFIEDSRVNHVNEIKEKLIATRYVHEMGMSSLLKSQDYLKNYSGGYFGLKNMEEENNIQLAGEERFLRYLVNQYFFPHTEMSTIAEYFDSEELQQKIILTITTSKLFQVYTFDNDMTCVIVKDWSVIKKTKCLLANLKEEVYEEQLLWMLRDIGVNVSDYKKDLYKTKNDRSISLLNNKYLYKKTETTTPELISLLEECYDFINDSARSYSLSELFELIDPRKTDFDYDQFVYAIKEDERFLILDNNQVLIK